MQRMMLPLRTCKICGLEANAEDEFEPFVRNRTSLYGYLNLCKKCHREDMKQRKLRTNDLVKVFREISPDGVIRCYFCNGKITKLERQDGDSLAIHSLDGDHENWNATNKMPTHISCHNRHHNTGKKSHNWKGDDASDSAKRKRLRRL